MELNSNVGETLAIFERALEHFSYPFGNLKNHRLTIKNPDMIFLLTNVAKT